MTEQVANLNIQEDVLYLRIENKALREVSVDLEAQIEKMKCALNKIIKTVQNDNISGYGDRLVKIYDISCEVLQEIKEK